MADALQACYPLRMMNVNRLGWMLAAAVLLPLWPARSATLEEERAKIHAENAALPPNTIKPMPWHVVDLWWDLGTNQAFDSYSIDIDIQDDIPDNLNLYIAPIGLGKLSGQGFYGGLQTHSDGLSVTEPVGQGIGRGIIFSRWDERDTAAIRPAAPGGYYQSSGSEGDFVSVRAKYAWTKGHYTYRLVKMDHGIVHGDKGTWVGGFVYSHERNENAFIGAMWFTGEDLVLDKAIASFVEIYGGRIPIESIPTFRIRYGHPTVNGKEIPLPGVKGHFDKGIPEVADVRWLDGMVQISVNATNQIVRPARNYPIHEAGKE
jgi:hypothetical protein